MEQGAYADGYKASNGDSSRVITEQKSTQNNEGSGASTNIICGEQIITSEAATACRGADDGNGNGNGGGFTIIVIGNEGTIECEPPLPPGDSFIAAIAEGDEMITGNYTITHIGMVTQQRTGELSAANTDGITYSINAENLGFCSDSVGEITISGDCGDNVTIRYQDPSAIGTFTGNVECLLSS